MPDSIVCDQEKRGILTETHPLMKDCEQPFDACSPSTVWSTGSSTGLMALPDYKLRTTVKAAVLSFTNYWQKNVFPLNSFRERLLYSLVDNMHSWRRRVLSFVWSACDLKRIWAEKIRNKYFDLLLASQEHTIIWLVKQGDFAKHGKALHFHQPSDIS